MEKTGKPLTFPLCVVLLVERRCKRRSHHELSKLFLGLGFFWAIWDKDGQAWHDKIAGTVVLRKG